MTDTNWILTTHTGSLPRPADLLDDSPSEPGYDKRLADAVTDAVEHQVASGIDVVSDGEMGKPGFVRYVRTRLNGFEEVASESRLALVDDFPGYLEWRESVGLRSPRAAYARAECVGPLSWKDVNGFRTDIDNLIAARDATGAREAFLPSASVGIIAQRLPNRYYPSYEAYVQAIAEVMRDEYRAIVEAGLMLQIDAPEMCIDRNAPEFADKPIEDFRARLELWVEGLNFALSGIDEERVRLHICWGNEEGPHTRDVALTDVLDIVLKVRAGAYSIEAANPRHAHEWVVWQDTKLPDGKKLIPGVIDTTTNFVEHPDLVAQRITTFAQLVGPENVIAGTDCGFGTNAAFTPVYPPVVWAKLSALAEGARRASEALRT